MASAEATVAEPFGKDERAISFHLDTELVEAERNDMKVAWGTPSSKEHKKDEAEPLHADAVVPVVSQVTVTTSDSLKKYMRRPDLLQLLGMALCVGILVAIVLPLITVAAQAWDRCRDGDLDPPLALLDRGNLSSDQVAMESVAGLLLTCYAAVPAAVFARSLTRQGRQLERVARAFGAHLVFLVMCVSLHACAAGLAGCEDDEGAQHGSLQVLVRVLSDLSYAGACVALQMGILMKAVAVQGRNLAICQRLYFGWLAFFVLLGAHWCLLKDANGFDRLLFTCVLVCWGIIGQVFAALVVVDLLRIRRELADAVGTGRSNRASVRRTLARSSAAIVAKHFTVMLVVLAVASGRRYDSAAFQNLCFLLDFLISVPCGFILAGLHSQRQVALDEDVQLAELQQRLDDAALRIKAELGYDIRGRMSRIASAALNSCNAYGLVLAKCFEKEPASLKVLCSIPCQRLHGERLVSVSEIPGEPDRSALDQGEAAAQMATLLHEAAAAQQYLKESFAPTSGWATSELDPTSLGTMTQNSAASVQDVRMLRDSPELVDFLDGAFDPGIKTKSRIKQKAKQKYGGNLRCVHDVARLAVFCDTVERLLGAVPRMLKMFEVIEVENRFAKPTPLGWMDLTFLVRVPLQLPDGRICKHTAEIQLQLYDFYEARVQNHKYYRVVRSALAKAGVQPEHLDVIQQTLLDAIEG